MAVWTTATLSSSAIYARTRKGRGAHTGNEPNCEMHDTQDENGKLHRSKPVLPKRLSVSRGLKPEASKLEILDCQSPVDPCITPTEAPQCAFGQLPMTSATVNLCGTRVRRSLPPCAEAPRSHLGDRELPLVEPHLPWAIGGKFHDRLTSFTHRGNGFVWRWSRLQKQRCLVFQYSQRLYPSLGAIRRRPVPVVTVRREGPKYSFLILAIGLRPERLDQTLLGAQHIGAVLGVVDLAAVHPGAVQHGVVLILRAPIGVWVVRDDVQLLGRGQRTLPRADMFDVFVG